MRLIHRESIYTAASLLIVVRANDDDEEADADDEYVRLQVTTHWPYDQWSVAQLYVRWPTAYLVVVSLF